MRNENEIKEVIENKINYLEKSNISTECLKKNHKQFIRNNKLILKMQQRFKSEKHVFPEEINKTALSSNDDKRIQSTDSIEIYAYGTNTDLESEK